MKTEYKIKSVMNFRNGTVALTGLLDGRPLEIGRDVGKRGVVIATTQKIAVEILGIGIVDPNLVNQNMQGILVKMLEGDIALLKGATLTFE